MKNKGHEWVAFLTEWLSRNKVFEQANGHGCWKLVLVWDSLHYVGWIASCASSSKGVSGRWKAVA